jgi:hypothetical protein
MFLLATGRMISQSPTISEAQTISMDFSVRTLLLPATLAVLPGGSMGNLQTLVILMENGASVLVFTLAQQIYLPEAPWGVHRARHYRVAINERELACCC